MSRQTWTLIDVDQDVYLDELDVSTADVPGATLPFRIRKRTLRGGLRDGVDVLEIDNGKLQFTVLLTRGLSLWKASCGDIQLGWQSPVRGPVHPKFVPLDAPDGIGWLRGFDEFLVRCGLESNGPPEYDVAGHLKNPLHGRVGNIPAHRVSVSFDPTTSEIRITGEVDETRLFGQKLRMMTSYLTRLGDPSVWIIDEVQNRSTSPADLELLYHINIGSPFLSPGAKIVAPVAKLIPRTTTAAEGIPKWDTYPAGKPGVAEEVFYLALAGTAEGNTRVLLHDPYAARGFSVQFNLRQLPYFIIWKCPLPNSDGYVTGLEPALNLPNPKSYEEQQQRVLRLPGGASYRAALRLEAHTDATSVAIAAQATRSLMAGQEPEIFDYPLPGWTVG